MFWSREKLEEKLTEIIFDGTGETPVGNPDNFDCAAYTLTVGPEVYVTPAKPAQTPKDGSIIKLEHGEDFKIPAGQFVFLITEEFLKIPKNAIGFVSLKTGSLKFKGLVNVSGFHVDPGYEGRFIFSAYNAGPTEIPVQRGEALANIWLASLDRETQYHYKKEGLRSIPSKTISGITGEVFSPIALKKRVDQLETKIENQKNVIISLVLLAIATALLSVAINLNAGWIKENFFPAKESAITQNESPNASKEKSR